jgi:hypothetical protein
MKEEKLKGKTPIGVSRSQTQIHRLTLYQLSYIPTFNLFCDVNIVISFPVK